MYYVRFLLLFIILSQIVLMSSPSGLIIVLPIKLKFPLKTLKALVAFGLYKAYKKKIIRTLFKIASPFVLRRTDPLTYRQQMESSSNNLNLSPVEFHQQEAQLFRYLSSEDKEGCLKRLVCEVHATTKWNAMGVAEKVIMDLFGQMSPQHQSLPSFEFHQAATIGHKSKDPRLCQQYYSSCPYSGQQLLASYKFYYPMQTYPP